MKTTGCSTFGSRLSGHHTLYGTVHFRFIITFTHTLHNLLCLALDEPFDTSLGLFLLSINGCLCLTRCACNGVCCLTTRSSCFILSDRTSDLSACYSTFCLRFYCLDCITCLSLGISKLTCSALLSRCLVNPSCCFFRCSYSTIII